MIRQEIYIKEYDWLVHCYFAVDCYYTNEIAEQLEIIGCSGEYLFRAVTNMASCALNQGLCYSNPSIKESVLVTSLTSNAAQFLNSLDHEIRHLSNHICGAYSIPLTSEESCYLSGGIAQKIYPYVSKLLCEHCRHNQLKYMNYEK